MSYVPKKRCSLSKKTKSKSVDVGGLSMSDLPVLRRKRTLALNRLRKLFEIANLANADSSHLEEFLAYYSSLTKHVENFEEAHLDILSVVDDTDAEEEDEIRGEFDEFYYKVLAIHKKLVPCTSTLAGTCTGRSSSSSSSTHAIRLPKIEVGKFSGNLKEFPMFLDSFNSLIHLNESLSDSDKMQYLRASLFGDALGLIRTFPVQGAYYREAYQTLVSRYRDKRELAYTCWRDMLNVNFKLNSATEFRRALDLFNENLVILKSLDLPTEHWDFILCYHVLSKLDSKTRCAFEKGSAAAELPNFHELKRFLESQCEALVRDTHFSGRQDVPISSTSAKPNKPSIPNSIRPTSSALLANPERATTSVKVLGPQLNTSTSPVSRTPTKCPFCAELHSINQCKLFSAKSVEDRRNHAFQHRWCFNCLKPSHVIRDCKSIFTCQKCRQKHHTLLHQDKDVTVAQQPLSVPEPVQVMTNVGPNSIVLLSTAVIKIRDSLGNYQSFRAVIDTGSQAHFISERAVVQLGLDKRATSRQVRGVGQSIASISGTVSLQIGVDNRTLFDIDALTIPHICGNMPSVRLDKSSWLHLHGLNLSDPNCDKPGPIDVLLGAEIFPSLLLPGKVMGKPKQPSAINSVFGWLLIGTVADSQDDDEINSFMLSEDHLIREVRKFWELDSLPCSSKMTDEDERCEQLYRNTTVRDPTGRYSVSLPFSHTKEPLFPGSRESALRRFHSLERRLSSNSELRKMYSEFMAEYISDGHMTLVPLQDLLKGKYYIPHHCVLRPDNKTSKLRTVFDASSKDPITGKSLNDSLLIGPKLQANILEILLRFRIHTVVFTADVRKMYRQILIHDEYRDFQRIFWRFDPSDPVMEYRLNTVTYGISSSPFLACRTIKQLANDEGFELQKGKQALLNDVYIDDVVTGCSTLNQAIQTKCEIINILKRGQMELRKWASNDPNLLSDLPPEHCLTGNGVMDVDKSDSLKILGLQWDARSDNFLFRVQPQNRVCTKRTILSELSRIYDPLGFLAPLTFIAKYLVQKLWILGISWDGIPPEDIKRQWTRYTDELPSLQHLRIPRWLSTADFKVCELHGFADSSTRGYGCVVYLRVVDIHDNVRVFFVMSKARVAPVKTISLARLELCAAVLLADVLKFVVEVFQPHFSISATYAWSDSMVTLAWIRSPPCRWKTLVANRVSHIQDTVPSATWRHVPSSDNPSDIPSRGQTPAELVHNSLWWAGPTWLTLDSSLWPHLAANPEVEDLSLEEKVQVLITREPPNHFIDDLLIRYSSIRKIQRIVGLCLRFIRNLRSKPRGGSTRPLSRSELHTALLTVVKHTQSLHFSDELKHLQSGKVLPKPLQKLNPFLDNSGLLRVGGRLSRSGLTYEHKHPVLLPRQSSLTYMIIDAMHRENCHPGINTLYYLITQQFWILSAKRAIRHQVSKCLRCFKTNPKPLEPFMSDLPAVRVNQVKPYSIVGVDYAGFFKVKSGRYRGARIGKAYLCLFICFATKAVHLEVASDLSSEAFIAALRRMVARRGRVSTIYSDRGTNFVGAHKELSSYMQDAARDQHIEFKFNPPASPHFGGIWEINVKAVKTLLYRVVGNQILTLDELNTLFIQIESLLNSRPLYPLSQDPNDFTVLTPGHFLTLEPLTSVPDQDLSSVNISRLGRWQLIQRFQQDFWKRWKTEYLQSLTQRAKWTKHARPLEIGSVVIVKSEAAPLQWPIARVERLHEGPDGVIRIATLRFPNGSFLMRPLTKVCPLPNQTD